MRAIILLLLGIFSLATGYSQTEKQLRIFEEIEKLSPPFDSTSINELDKATKATGLTYELPKEYAKYPYKVSLKSPENPEELVRVIGGVFPEAGGIITSIWAHEDEECILFIKCHGMINILDKTEDRIQPNAYNRIRSALGMGEFFNLLQMRK